MRSWVLVGLSLAVSGCRPSRVVLEVDAFQSDSVLEADELTIIARGDVDLRAGVKARRLEVRARRFAVGRVFEVGEARIHADDHAITFSTPTVVMGTVMDVDDIVVAPGVTLTLASDTTLSADSNGDGAGRIVMQPGSRVTGPFTLQLTASGTSTLQTIDVGRLVLGTATPCAQFTASATITTGDFSLEGATLNLGAPLSISGSNVVIDGIVNSTSTIDFRGSGPQTVSVGAATPGDFLHTGSGSLRFVSRYTSRVALTLPALDGGGGALTDFPVPIVLNGASALFADGGAFAVTDEEHRLLPFEVEQLDPTARRLVLWTKLRRVDPSRPPQLFFLSGARSDSSCNVPSEVWSSDYVAVFHFGERDGGVAFDSTRFRHDAQPDGTSSSTGRIGGARTFTGVDRLRLSATPALNTTALTLEVHAAPGGLSGPGFGGNRIVDRSWTAQPGGWSVFVWEAREVGFNGMNDAGQRVGFGASTIFGLNRWFSTAVVLDDVSGRTWVDGVASGPVPLMLDGGSVLDTNTSFCLSSCYSWDPWVGSLDELRLSRVARSDEWVRYSSQLVASPPVPSPPGAHVFDLATGAVCRAEAPCRSGTCSDGRCCQRSCGPCERCDAPGQEGVCVPVRAAADPDSCAQCDANGVCVVTLDAGSPADAGLTDAGSTDDAGSGPLGVAPDGGLVGRRFAVGCQSGATGTSLAAVAVLLMLDTLRRKAPRRRSRGQATQPRRGQDARRVRRRMMCDTPRSSTGPVRWPAKLDD